MIYINNNLQKINNLTSIFENIFGSFYIYQKLKENNIECEIFYHSYIFKTFLKNIPLAKYNITDDNENLFENNNIIYLLNPTFDDILSHIKEYKKDQKKDDKIKDIIFDIFFNIYDFSFYKQIDELDIKKIFNNIFNNMKYNTHYKRLIYISNLDNIDKIFDFNDSYIIYNHINDTEIVSILSNKMNIFRGNEIRNFIDKNKNKLIDKNIQILNITNNIYEYYEKLFLNLLFSDEIIIDINRFTIWLLKLRNKNTIIKSNIFKIHYECIYCKYLYPKNFEIKNKKSRIIYDASHLDGIGTIFYNLLMLMDDYKDCEIFLLDDFIPEHEKSITIKYIFPNIKIIDKNTIHEFISINYDMSILTYINIHDIRKTGYDIIFTGTNFAFKPLKLLTQNIEFIKDFKIKNNIELNPKIIDDIKYKYDYFFNTTNIKIGVHVRRGDYLKYLSKNQNSFVCLLYDDYYINSINKILKEINDKKYIIYFFAEDDETINYINSKLINSKINHKINHKILPLDIGINHIYLLSLCDYIIMSSSTFSLGGYIFNKIYQNRDINIIAPSEFSNPRSSRHRYYTQKTDGIINIIKQNGNYEIIDIKCAINI